MKRPGKIFAAVIFLTTLSMLAVGCSKGQNQNASTQKRDATVTIGNISTSITSVGNLDLSQTQDLAFAQDGTVDQVMVSDADAVKKGEVLAKLSSTDWDNAISALEDKITADQRTIETKQRAVVSAQQTLTSRELSVISDNLTVTSKQLDLNTANYNLSQLSDIKTLQDQIDQATQAYQFATNMLAGNLGGGTSVNYSYWSQAQSNAKSELDADNTAMKALKSGRNITISTTVAADIASKQLAIQQAELALTTANNTLANAVTAVEQGKVDIQNAIADVASANETLTSDQSDLQTLKDTPLDIVAPFDGFVTNVNVAGGDVVKKGTVAVTVADPTKFEADIYVSENDIMNVTINQTATVNVDAAPGISIPAKVTYIAPTATNQQGVVNYEVKVELATPSAVMIPGFSANSTDNSTGFFRRPQGSTDNGSRSFFGQRGGATDNGTSPFSGQPGSTANATQSASGQLPARLQQAVDSGRMTQQQAEQLMSRFSSGGGNFGGGAGGFAGGGQGAGQTNSATSTDLTNFQLKQGLSVTVDIVVNQRNNVLLVPNAAISVQGGTNYVNVVNADGSVTRTAIQTGISDFQNTEVISGLKEGDKVELTAATSATSSSATTSTPQRGGAVRIPGIGFGGR